MQFFLFLGVLCDIVAAVMSISLIGFGLLDLALALQPLCEQIPNEVKACK